MNTVIFKLYGLDYSFFEFFIRDPVAQVVEQRPFKADVEGSSPSWVTFHFPSQLILQRVTIDLIEKHLYLSCRNKKFIIEKIFLFLKKY